MATKHRTKWAVVSSDGKSGVMRNGNLAWTYNKKDAMIWAAGQSAYKIVNAEEFIKNYKAEELARNINNEVNKVETYPNDSFQVYTEFYTWEKTPYLIVFNENAPHLGHIIVHKLSKAGKYSIAWHFFFDSHHPNTIYKTVDDALCAAMDLLSLDGDLPEDF